MSEDHALVFISSNLVRNKNRPEYTSNALKIVNEGGIEFHITRLCLALMNLVEIATYSSAGNANSII